MADIGLLTAFGAGLLSFLSPCLLPLVPAYLCFLAGTSLDDLLGRAARRGPLLRALAFVLGFSAVFVALGAGASTLGTLLANYAEALARIAGLVIVALGLHMTGVVRLAPLLREIRTQPRTAPRGLAGAFVVGLAFAFGWSPCVGPVLAAILLLAGMEDTVGRGTALLAAYAAGLGLPFLAAAALTGPFLGAARQFRPYLRTVEAGLGAVLVAAGLAVFAGWMPSLAAALMTTFPTLGRIG